MKGKEPLRRRKSRNVQNQPRQKFNSSLRSLVDSTDLFTTDGSSGLKFSPSIYKFFEDETWDSNPLDSSALETNRQPVKCNTPFESAGGRSLLGGRWLSLLIVFCLCLPHVNSSVKVHPRVFRRDSSVWRRRRSVLDPPCRSDRLR